MKALPPVESEWVAVSLESGLNFRLKQEKLKLSQRRWVHLLVTAGILTLQSFGLTKCHFAFLGSEQRASS